MRNLKDISNFYFVGIGGIGMSALARYFAMQHKNIYGYDRVSTKLTDELSHEGMHISFEDSVESIPSEIREDQKTLVVYTPAITRENNILDYFFSNNFWVIKRAELLGEISKNSFCLAVTGTHGKTTTSSILGHMMVTAGKPVTVFLGGIAENYNSNFIYRGNEFTVVEADEYDRSFLQLKPDVACITSMDADHLDIYGSASEMESAFRDFESLVKNKENILYKKGLDLEGKTVAIGEPADYEVNNLRVMDGSYHFDLKTPEGLVEDLVFHLPGRHNVLNAVMAFGMAQLAGISPSELRKALDTFKGVDRRFTYKIKTENLILIDDYAHHPVELAALHQAVEEMYPNEEKQLIFQPHLYTRTRDFEDDFADSLSLFDEVVLLDIYPAREKPIPGITSSWLLEKITAPKKKIIQKEGILESVKNTTARIHLMVGAGDIGAEIEKVTKALKS